MNEWDVKSPYGESSALHAVLDTTHYSHLTQVSKEIQREVNCFHRQVLCERLSRGTERKVL